MRIILNILGIGLIILGILVFSFKGFSYTEEKQIAQFGDIHVTEKRDKNFFFPPLLGGLSIAAGIVLLVVGRLKK